MPGQCTRSLAEGDGRSAANQCCDMKADLATIGPEATLKCVGVSDRLVSFWAIQYATRVALGPGKAQRRVHGLPARVRVDREQDVRATVSQAVPIAVRPMVCSWLRRSAR